MSVALTIMVNGNGIRVVPEIPWTAGMNAQVALERAYDTCSGYSFLLRFYGPLGYEAVAFDGIIAQTGSDIGLYWEFFVNGKSSMEGIDSAIVEDGDELLFSYVAYEADHHSGTRLEAIHQRSV